METSPDSALRILKRIQSTQYLSNSDKALYGLLLFQALDKNDKPLQPDSVLIFSLKYYQNSNNKSRLAFCYFYKARIFKNAQRYDDATVLYLKALDCIQDKKDYVLMGKIYADMGDICSIQLDYKESLRKYQLSVNYFNRAGKRIDASYRLIDIGRTFQYEKKYKTALNYYRRALVSSNDSILCGFALQEIGSNYYWEKQYDSAQFYLRKSLRFPYKENNYALRCFNLADLFFDVEQYDSAFLYASTALKYPSSFFTKRECYRLLANTEYLKGNFKQMAISMTHFQACSDSVRKIESQTKIAVLENLHQTSESANKTKRYLLVLGWILPLIVSVSLYVLYLLRLRNKGKEKQLEQIEGQLEVQINEKKNLLVESLHRRIEEARILHANIYKKASIAEREQLDKDLYNACLYLNDWNRFKQLMNKTFNNVVDSLENENPDITHKELIWCCLFLLDVRSQDIALILDTQLASLYKLKQRLAQKMNLNSTRELDAVLINKSKGKLLS